MKTTAAVLPAVGAPFRVEAIDLAEPKREEARIRVEACGVCASDWNLATGATRHPLPVVVGHEGVGVIEEVGPGVEHLRAGDRVVLSWTPHCGACFHCLRARPGLCETNTPPIWAGALLDGTTRFALDGAPVHHYCGLACLAERTVVPAASCIPCPEDVPATVAALIGCAVTTGMGAAIETARVRPGESVLVYGVGGVGLSAVMGARESGAANVFAVDRTAERAGTAVPFGATRALVDGDDVVDAVRAATGGRGADVVIDTTAKPSIQERCVELARPGGRIVLVGLGAMDATIRVAPASLTRQEKQIVGSYYGSSNPPRDFPRIIELYRAGRLPLDRLVSRTYRLDQVNEAFADLVAGELLRGVVTM